MTDSSCTRKRNPSKSIQELQAEMEEVSKKTRREIEELVDEATDRFQKTPTYENFYAMCDIVRQTDDWQCGDVLVDMAEKIPLPELRKIIDFLETEGKDPKWNSCDVGINTIIAAHSCGDIWAEMSEERLECLQPFMTEGFWENLIVEEASLRNPANMPLDDLRMVLQTIIGSE